MDSSFTFKPGAFFFFGLLVILSVVIADQYSKWLVMETMLRTGGETPDFLTWLTTVRPLPEFVEQRETYKTITLASFLNFVMVWNTGISFGLFGDLARNNPKMLSMILTGVTMLISMLLLLWLVLARTRLVAWALSLIIGGAIGNIIDRVRFGAVVDFIDAHINDIHWPAFNLADSCIVLGAGLLILHALTTKETNPFWG